MIWSNTSPRILSEFLTDTRKNTRSPSLAIVQLRNQTGSSLVDGLMSSSQINHPKVKSISFLEAVKVEQENNVWYVGVYLFTSHPVNNASTCSVVFVKTALRSLFTARRELPYVGCWTLVGDNRHEFYQSRWPNLPSHTHGHRCNDYQVHTQSWGLSQPFGLTGMIE